MFPNIFLAYLQVSPARIHKPDIFLSDFGVCTQTSLLEDTFLWRYHKDQRESCVSIFEKEFGTQAYELRSLLEGIKTFIFCKNTYVILAISMLSWAQSMRACFVSYSLYMILLTSKPKSLLPKSLQECHSKVLDQESLQS